MNSRMLKNKKKFRKVKRFTKDIIFGAGIYDYMTILFFSNFQTLEEYDFFVINHIQKLKPTTTFFLNYCTTFR